MVSKNKFEEHLASILKSQRNNSYFQNFFISKFLTNFDTDVKEFASGADRKVLCSRKRKNDSVVFDTRLFHIKPIDRLPETDLQVANG